MSRYILRHDGYSSYKKIMTRGKWIGRVCRCADGSFLGIIGKTEFRSDTENSTFKGVIARHCGFDSATEFAENNRRIREENKRNLSEARRAANAMVRGNFEPFMRLMDQDK